MKQKLQDNIAEKIISKNGAPITVSEHDAIVAQVKRETAEAHAAVLESKGLWLKCMSKITILNGRSAFDMAICC